MPMAYEEGSLDLELKKKKSEYAGLEYEVGSEEPEDNPIIVQALAASVVGNPVLVIENPEAHLHPLSQSGLGKFLALVSADGLQVIVETHSGHIVDGCRIQAAVWQFLVVLIDFIHIIWKSAQT